MIKRVRDYGVIRQLQDDEHHESNAYLVKKDTDELLRVARVYKTADLEAKKIKNILNEIRILASIDHPNILKYYEAFVEEKLGLIIIITEYCDQSSFRNFYEECRPEENGEQRTYLEKHLRSFIVQIILAMRELQRFNIMHRDIKPSNLFLTSEPKIKLGDFTRAKFFMEDMNSTQIGTPQYASPEVFENKKYTVKSDIWSLGVVLYEVMYEYLPFENSKLDNLKKSIVAKDVSFKSEIFFDEFDDVMDIIMKCLSKKPADRPSLEELLASETFQEPLKEYYKECPELQKREKENVDMKLIDELKADYKDTKDISKKLKKARDDRVDEVLKGRDDLLPENVKEDLAKMKHKDAMNSKKYKTLADDDDEKERQRKKKVRIEADPRKKKPRKQKNRNLHLQLLNGLRNLLLLRLLRQRRKLKPLLRNHPRKRRLHHHHHHRRRKRSQKLRLLNLQKKKLLQR